MYILLLNLQMEKDAESYTDRQFFDDLRSFGLETGQVTWNGIKD